MNSRLAQTPITTIAVRTYITKRVLQFIVLAGLFSLGAHANAATRNVPSGTYPTIQSAVVASAPGDTIVLDPGTYAENITIDKWLILKGSGSGNNPLADSIIQSVGANTPVIRIIAGGDNATDRLILQDIRVTGGTGAAGHGIEYSVGSTGYTTFDNVSAVNNGGSGLSMGSLTPVTDFVVQNSNLSYNGDAGLRGAATGTSIDGLQILNSHLDHNSAGLTVYTPIVTNWVIKNSTFNDNVGPNQPYVGGYGMYFEGHTVNNINIDCSEFNRNMGSDDTGANYSAGLIFFPFLLLANYSDITIQHSQFNDNPGAGIWIQPEVGTSMSDIKIDCDAFERNSYGILVFDGGAISGFSIHHSNFVGNLVAAIYNLSSANIEATLNWWGAADGPGGDNPGSGDAIYNTGAGSVTYIPFRTTSSACPSACVAAPAITILKKTNGTDNDTAPGLYVSVPSTVNWTYLVTNTGNVPLNNVIVSDDQGVTVTCPTNMLADGESMTCNASGAAVVGQYTNIGSVTGTPPTGPNVIASNPDNYFGSAPGISIVKLTNGTNNDVGTGPFVPVGSTVTWTYNVTNTGNVTLTNVTVTDDKVGAICTIPTMAPGANASCSKNGIATVGQYTNYGTATGTPPVGSNVTATNVDHYFGQAASISIVKKTNGTDNDAAPGPTVAVGSTVTWTYFVTNTGNVPLTGVTVTDNKVGFICTIGTLAPGGTGSCTKTGTALVGQYTNIGTATGTPPIGPNVTAANPDNYFGQASCPSPGTISFTGSTPTYGSAGNIRPFSSGGVNVRASAFSRIRSNGTWNTAYLGSFSGGLGVTDGSEGNGGNNTHKIDNLGGRDNYVLLEFSSPVVIDKAFLDWVGADSDVTVWIGTKTDPYNNHQNLSNAYFTGLYTEENATPTVTSGSRWADLNATQVSGNVVVIAAQVSDQSPEDAFKLSKLTLGCPPPPVCGAGTFYFSGNTATSGTAGNTKTFTVNGVTVKASAFSRADSNGAWATAYLGVYSGGLGVTDTGEGSGSNNTHKVDNLGGRNNYVLFEFSSQLVVDQAYLDIIGADSDMSAWIGTKPDPINNHLTLSDAMLTSLGAREDSTTTSTAPRWANINAGNVLGNVLVISSKPGDATLNDAFKISKLAIKCQ